MSLMNKFKYISHKYIRWFSAAFLAFWLVTMLGAIVVLGGMNEAVTVVVVGVGLLLIGRRFDVPIVSALTEIAMSIVATGLGVIEAISGHNYQIWSPARGRQE